MLLLGGGAAAGQANLPLPVISDLKRTEKKKEKKERKKKALASTSLHTHPNIYTEGGAGATLNPPQRFLSPASFFFIFLFEVRARRVTGGKGSFALREDLSSVLYSVARVCPCARALRHGFRWSGMHFERVTRALLLL